RLVTGEPSAVTGADGSFSFVLPSLDPGEVFIRQVVPNTDAATVPTNNQAVSVFVPGNTSNIPGVALGTTSLRSITGLVFDDVNANGVRDTGEGLLTNTTPFLDVNGDGVRQSYGSRTFNSVDVPRTISGVTAIDSGVNIAGSGLITDLNVTLNMSLDDNAPVSAFLISPRGRRVELFSGLSGQGLV